MATSNYKLGIISNIKEMTPTTEESVLVFPDHVENYLLKKALYNFDLDEFKFDKNNITIKNNLSSAQSLVDEYNYNNTIKFITNKDKSFEQIALKQFNLEETIENILKTLPSEYERFILRNLFNDSKNERSFIMDKYSHICEYLKLKIPKVITIYDNVNYNIPILDNFKETFPRFVYKDYKNNTFVGVLTKNNKIILNFSLEEDLRNFDFLHGNLANLLVSALTRSGHGNIYSEYPVPRLLSSNKEIRDSVQKIYLSKIETKENELRNAIAQIKHYEQAIQNTVNDKESFRTDLEKAKAEAENSPIYSHIELLPKAFKNINNIKLIENDNSTTLSFFTDNLSIDAVLQPSLGKIPIGKFKIKINLDIFRSYDQDNISITSISPPIGFSPPHIHPHIQGSVCFGSFDSNILLNVNNNNLMGLVGTILVFLQTVNIKDSWGLLFAVWELKHSLANNIFWGKGFESYKDIARALGTRHDYVSNWAEENGLDTSGLFGDTVYDEDDDYEENPEDFI